MVRPPTVSWTMAAPLGSRGALHPTPAPVEKPACGKAVRVGIHRHRATNDAQQSGPEARDLHLRKVRGRPLGTNGGLVQDLVGDPVPNTRESGLVEQHGLDRRVARADLAESWAAAGRPKNGSWPSPRRGGSFLGIVSEAKPSKATRVGEGKAAIVVERELELQEARRLGGGPKESGSLPSFRSEKPARASDRARTRDACRIVRRPRWWRRGAPSLSARGETPERTIESGEQRARTTRRPLR